MTGQARRALILIWLCFIARGVFYARLLPLWEGYDEWSHFAYVQHVANGHWISIPGKTRPSREVAESLTKGPVAWSQLGYVLNSISYEQWWRLSEQERDARTRALTTYETGEDPRASPNYESQQPPLYYRLMALPLRLASSWTLPARVFLLRILSVLIASLVLPVTFALAQRVLKATGPALATTAMVAVMPEFAVDVARVGNECVSVVLFAVLAYLLATDRHCWWKAGTTLALGLMNKAFFLTALPVIAVAAGPLAAALGALGGGWWYALMKHWTGSWTGQSQQIALASVSLGQEFAAALRIDWIHALDTLARTHIWFGGWSFLTLRSWIYRLLFVLGTAALAGLPRAWRSSDRERRRVILLLLALEASFLASLGYHVVVTFLANGVAATNGWYLYELIAAEVVLLSAGWLSLASPSAGPWIVASCCALCALLDLYGVLFVMAPYYAGLIGHNATGALGSLHLNAVNWSQVHSRLPLGFGVAWIAATIAVVAAAYRSRDLQ